MPAVVMSAAGPGGGRGAGGGGGGNWTVGREGGWKTDRGRAVRKDREARVTPSAAKGPCVGSRLLRFAQDDSRSLPIEISPARAAIVTASVRFPAPSFANSELTWNLTVRSDTPSSAAI